MAECVECGRVPGEIGHRCNRCGEEVCWDHRHALDHDCGSRPDPPTSGEERWDDPDEEWTRGDHGVEAPPVDAGEWAHDDPRFPWWVYVLVALAVAVAPVSGFLVSILL